MHRLVELLTAISRCTKRLRNSSHLPSFLGQVDKGSRAQE